MVGQFVTAALLLSVGLAHVGALAPGKDSKRRNVKAVATPSPELIHALERPQQLFDSMHSRLSDLVQSLTDSKSENLKVVLKQREVYDEKLVEQQKRNNATRAMNQNINRHISILKADNKRLRDRANDLDAQCKHVKMDLETLYENVTVAKDYLDRVLNTSKFSLGDAPEVNILAELEQEDIKLSESQLHKDRLDEIVAAAKMSMIQVGSRDRKLANDPMPEEMLQSLLASWDGLANDQNTSMSSLQESFEKEFQAGEELYAMFLENQTQLNDTLAEQEALKQNLTVAVEYLTKTHQHLLEQRSSLKQFARHLSHRTIPALKLYTKFNNDTTVPPPVSALDVQHIPKKATSTSVKGVTARVATKSLNQVPLVDRTMPGPKRRSQPSASIQKRDSGTVASTKSASLFSWLVR